MMKVAERGTPRFEITLLSRALPSPRGEMRDTSISLRDIFLRRRVDRRERRRESESAALPRRPRCPEVSRSARNSGVADEIETVTPGLTRRGGEKKSIKACASRHGLASSPPANVQLNGERDAAGDFRGSLDSGLDLRGADVCTTLMPS